MRRIRVALVLVSVATLGLVAALAWRALEGLAVERAVRHEAVAERAFDEMERALSQVLAREEDRAFEDYAFYLPGTGERSPLSAPLEPFVVGAFQVDPAGRVTTPLEPADAAAARARGDWPPAPEVGAAIARVRRVVASVWAEGRARELASAAAAERPARGPAAAGEVEPAAPAVDEVVAQAPGTTRAVSGPGVGGRAERAREDAAHANEETRSLADALQALNLGAEARSVRGQKVVSVPRSVLEAEEAGAARAYAPGAVAPTSPEPAGARAPEALGALAKKQAARPAEPPPAASAPVRIAIDPMVGRAVDADTLVLYRTVLVGERGWRQGLVIDRSALAAWLEQTVIAPSGLGRVARLSFAGPPADSAGRDVYVFAHRFAEPFDAVLAHLTLHALPGVGRPWALWGLVAVLLGVGAAGLVAVHRTAAVAVQYAERRGNFVAAVTHELKTPLTAIRMYAEMLRDGLVPGEGKRREYYGTITDESERLSRLVDNVLEFSRLESGRRDLRETVGGVAPVLEEAASKLRAHAERAGFALEVAAEPGLPAVRFDRDALLQVLFNLVDNAMKYARDAADRRVVLEAGRDGDEVVVAVRDFGPGVSRGHLERIFEPFYRGEAELTRTARGTGIGLALVKDLAERMGAVVAGGNALDGGFRVRVVFPAAAAAAG